MGGALLSPGNTGMHWRSKAHEGRCGISEGHNYYNLPMHHSLILYSSDGNVQSARRGYKTLFIIIIIIRSW